MKKSIIRLLLIVILLVIIAGAWLFLGPSTAFNGNKYTLLVRTGMTYQELKDQLEKDTVVKSPAAFDLLAKKMDYPANVKAGKYEIKRGMNLFSIIRMLHNGRQTPVNLIITKLRTREDLASYVGKHFECDSVIFMRFLENNDSLKTFGLDSNTVITAVFPNTYTYFWNTTPEKIFKKIFAYYKSYWTEERMAKASGHGLNPTSAYILASLVEEETTRDDDRGKIASVYINRIKKGMKLAADPTIKYALRNFEMKRVYEKYLSVESPYNTYKYAGLPPGPICTPSRGSLEAVLNAPQTNYLFFVAKPDFSGYSNFAENFEDHQKNARAYQKALDHEMQVRDSLNKMQVK